MVLFIWFTSYSAPFALKSWLVSCTGLDSLGFARSFTQTADAAMVLKVDFDSMARMQSGNSVDYSLDSLSVGFKRVRLKLVEGE